MKTVLILAVNFPPKGGVGVIRTLKFVKYLPVFGWNPVVVTPESNTKRKQDTSFLDSIPPKVEVHRPRFKDIWNMLPGDLVKLLKPIQKRYAFPDKYVRWHRAALNHISQHLLPKRKFDVIYTSVGPHSTLLLAQTLKRQYRIPLVIDFRDPFSFKQYSVYESDRRWMERAAQVEKSVFGDADHIINVSQVWKEKYESLYPEIAGRSSFIPNGYDEDDFRNLSPKQRNEIFTLGYNGSFSRIVPLEPLLDALDTIYRTHNIPIRLRIASPAKVDKFKSKYPSLFQNNLIDNKGYLPHTESLKNLNSSDVSVLILADIPATRGMIPAKSYEYLRINNPILFLHKKDRYLSRFLEPSHICTTTDIDDPAQIRTSLLDLHRRWEKGALKTKPDWDVIRGYERRYLTGELADIFESLT